MARKHDPGVAQEIPLEFPFRGLHEACAITEQPEGTTGTAMNVRGFDSAARRDRGGQRPGLVKWHDALEVSRVDAISQLSQTSASVNGGGFTVLGVTHDAGYTGSGSFPDAVGIPDVAPVQITVTMTLANSSSFASVTVLQNGVDGHSMVVNFNGTPIGGRKWIDGRDESNNAKFTLDLNGSTPPIGTEFHVTITTDAGGNITMSSTDVSGATPEAVSAYTFIPDVSFCVVQARGNNGVSDTNGVVSASVAQQSASSTLLPAHSNRYWQSLDAFTLTPLATSRTTAGVNDLALLYEMTITFSSTADSIQLSLNPDGGTGGDVVVTLSGKDPIGADKWIHIATTNGSADAFDEDMGRTNPPVGTPFHLSIMVRQGEFFITSDNLSKIAGSAIANTVPYDWLGAGPATATTICSFAKPSGRLVMAVFQTKNQADNFPLDLPLAYEADGYNFNSGQSIAAAMYYCTSGGMAGLAKNDTTSGGTGFLVTEAFNLGTAWEWAITGNLVKGHTLHAQADLNSIDAGEAAILFPAGSSTPVTVLLSRISNVNKITVTASGTSGVYVIPSSWTSGGWAVSLRLGLDSTITVTFNGTVIGLLSGAGFDYISSAYSIKLFNTNTNSRITGSSITTTGSSQAVTTDSILIAQGGNLYLSVNGEDFNQVDTSPIGSGDAYNKDSEMQVCPAGGYFWIVDGSVYVTRVDAATGVIDRPASTGGSIPPNARGIVLYRDRLFYFRFSDDPRNYFASKSGDYLNFDAGDITPVGAFAGNDTQQAGLLGDIITSMTPYGDQTMIIGTATDISVMRGDPKAGGSIDLLSREIGVAGPTAWSRDPEGNFYFMAKDGLYMLDGGLSSGPKAVSRGRLDRSLGEVNYAAVKVLMAWDPREFGTKIYLLGNAATATTNVVFWDKRKDAFWTDQYPPGIGPTAVGVVHGQGGDERLVLLGGWDGVIRGVDLAATDDDGLLISSSVMFTPVQPGGLNQQVKIQAMRLVWGDGGAGGFNASYLLRVGEDAITATRNAQLPPTTVTQGAYQGLDRTRTRGGCVILQISNNVLSASWQIEKCLLSVLGGGRVRT